MRKRTTGLTAAIVFFLSVTGCAQLGKLAPSATLALDSAGIGAGDMAGSGPQQVVSERVIARLGDEELTVVLYQPAASQALRPAVVFLPGLMASDDQYESYARALASRGFVVAMHGWYSPFTDDEELARHANFLADWLVQRGGVDPRRIGIAGHSMGGKDAVLAASRYGRFAGVVAIDPDDAGEFSVVHELLPRLRSPLLLIGGEVGWRAADICAPSETNYRRFFEHAPRGTVELTLRDADHVQMLDEPDRFGYDICRCGTADSRQVRITSRRATVGFFVQHLQAGPALSRPSGAQTLIRVAQGT